jgi:uncharacterized protein YbaR (Trm112 family)
MPRYNIPIFERAIRAVACANCQSVTKLKLEDDQLRCRDCNATYEIIDGVLDLMPPSYSGYKATRRKQPLSGMLMIVKLSAKKQSAFEARWINSCSRRPLS